VEHIALTLTRHGQSRGDLEGVHEGRYDAPLTDLGRAQACALAQDWARRGVMFDAVVCSPLQRARETAEVIAAALGLQPHLEPLWLEADNTPVAGMPFEEADRRYPRPAFRNPYEPHFGTGESAAELHRRAGAALERAVRFGAERLLVVAHGAVLNAAMRNVVGASPAPNESGLMFAFGDTGSARLEYQPARHEWVVLGINERPHLTDFEMNRPVGPEGQGLDG